MMCDIIINFIIKENIKMTVGLAEEIANKIKLQFPSESKVLYYYKEKGKAPLGKIYSKYFNKLRKLKIVGIIPHINKNRECVSGTSPTSTVIQEADCEESLAILLDDNCSWAEVERCWNNTTATRIKQIKLALSTDEILTKWSHYKKPLGYKLIEIDFQKIHKFASIETTFGLFLRKMIPILDEKVKGADDRNQLEILKCEENFNENSQAAILFHLIHHVLQPTSRKVLVENNKKVYIRFSVQDAQHSFILIGATAEQLEEKLQFQLKKQQSIQPLLLITGSLSSPNKIMIYFDGIRYKIFSILHGIDTLFSIFNLFNLKYPLQSFVVWTFIQRYFYKFITKYDAQNAAMKYLFERLQN